MISNQEWLMIKHSYQQGIKKAEIARELDLDPRAVKKALLELEEEYPQGFRGRGRRRRPSILDPYKAYIQNRLSKYNLTASRLLRETKEQGYKGSYTILKDYVREIRPPKAKEAFVRFETPPGEQAQADWAEFGTIPLELEGGKGGLAKLYCFSMVLGYSRCMYIEFTVSEDLFHLCEAHIRAFEYFGGVPKTILYDNMKPVVISRRKEVRRFPNPDGGERRRVYPRKDSMERQVHRLC